MLSGDTMNNKGFTLVEILAAIVILGLVMVIGVSGVTSFINNSKKKSEEIFIDKFRESIIEYLDLYGMGLSVRHNDKYKFNKCIKNDCYDEEENNYKDGEFYSSNVDVLDDVNVSELINEKILAKSSIVNPRNKKECFDNVYPYIKVFRDEDFVYYFYVNLGEFLDDKGEKVTNTCEISDERAVINTVPNSLILNTDCEKLDNDFKKIKNELIDKTSLEEEEKSKMICE